MTPHINFLPVFFKFLNSSGANLAPRVASGPQIRELKCHNVFCQIFNNNTHKLTNVNTINKF